MPEEMVGKVVKFFARPSVAAIEVTESTLKIGDTIHIVGHTTDLTEVVTSMEIENRSVEKTEIGETAGVKVKDRVRPNDIVYRVLE